MEKAAADEKRAQGQLVALGFTEGNPFEQSEAESERQIITRFFVEVEGFEKTKENRSMVIFAPRGCGKTALRVYFGNEAAPISPGSSQLAIEYTHFERALAICRRGERVLIDHHIQQILYEGAANLLKSVVPGYAPHSIWLQGVPDAAEGVALPRPLQPSARPGLARLLHHYRPDLLDAERLYPFIQSRYPNLDISWPEFYEAANQRTLKRFLTDAGHSAVFANLAVQQLVALNDMPVGKGLLLESSPYEQMQSFAELAALMDFSEIDILIDRLDETVETASSPAQQADLAEPLLANLPLMEMPGVNFKLFLSQEARDDLINRATIRRDRLTDHAVHITWKAEHLRDLLNQRLDHFSKGAVRDLGAICVEEPVQEGEGPAKKALRLCDWILEDMIGLAQGSPRRLLTEGNLLLQACLERGTPDANIRIMRMDWEKAREQFFEKTPPTLSISRGRPLAWVAGRQVSLTKDQHKILLVLIDHKGRCSQEILYQNVWGAQGVSDEAAYQAVTRLRKSISDNAKNPVYLIRSGDFLELRSYKEVE